MPDEITTRLTAVESRLATREQVSAAAASQGDTASSYNDKVGNDTVKSQPDRSFLLSTVTIRVSLFHCLWSCSLELYWQAFETYPHHHPVSSAISKLNYLARHMVLIHHSMFLIGLL